MLFNIFWYGDSGRDIYPLDYVATVDTPDAESAVLQFAEEEFGAQNAFTPNRWSHIPGTDLIGHRYYGFFKTVSYDRKFPQK